MMYKRYNLNSLFSQVECSYGISVLCVAFFLTFTTGSLSAQRASELSAPYDLRVEWGDSLQVSFNVIVGNDAVASRYRLLETPWIVGQRDSLSLPGFEVRGKRFQRYYQRKHYLQGVDVRGEAFLCAGDTLHYSAKVAIAPWMREGNLSVQLHRELEGCCEVTLLDALPLRAVITAPVLEEVELEPAKTVGDLLAEEKPILQHVSSYEAYDPSVPLRRMPDAKIIYFELSDTIVNADFKHNRETLDEIIAIAQKMNVDSASHIVTIRIVGLASLDGRLAFNEKIAGGRARALQSAIAEATTTPIAVFEAINGGEAWADFRDAVAESDLAEKQEVIELIDSTPDREECERKLRSMKGGRVWNELKTRFLGENRNAGYIRMYYENN